MFVVEKGPEPPKSKRRYTRYPFAEMLVGDSFEIKTAEDAIRVRSATRDYMRRHPELAFRVAKDRESGAWRCWRVESV